MRLIAHDFDDRFGCISTNRLSLPVAGTDWIRRVTFGPAIKPDALKAHRLRLSEIGLPLDKVSASKLYGPLTYRIDLSDETT